MDAKERNILIRQLVENFEFASKAAIALIDATPEPEPAAEPEFPWAVQKCVADAAVEIMLQLPPSIPRRDIFPALQRLYERAHAIGAGFVHPDNEFLK